jgi:hypothetical protein
MGTNPVLDMTEYHVAGILSLEERYGFVLETNFLQYKEAIYNLIEEIYNRQKYEDIKKFSKTIPNEDLFSTSQSAFDLLPIPDLLEHEFGPTNSRDIEEYIDAYQELGMFMEKAVRILIAIEKILNGETLSYSDIKKFNTGNYVAELKSKKNFRPLVHSFNITVHNALRHAVGGKLVQPSLKKVKFMDNQNSVSWTYETLVRQTRDLYVLVYLLSHFENLLHNHVLKKLLNCE